MKQNSLLVILISGLLLFGVVHAVSAGNTYDNKQILNLNIDPLSSAVLSGESTEYSVVLDSAPTGLSGYNLTISLSDGAVGEITDIALPAWVTLSLNSTLPASSVWIKTTDLGKKIQPGAVDVPMGTITVTGLATGVADLSLVVGRMDDDDGFALNSETGTAAFYVNLLPAPVAKFSNNVTSGTAPLTVQFTDLSTGEEITAHAWDFDNDGITDSTEVNPVHTYDSAGVYTVSLTVTNEGGSSTETKADCITVDPAVLHLNFDPITSTVLCGESSEYVVVLDSAPTGLSGYNLTVSLSDDAVGEITAVDLPAWASLSSNGTVPASSVWIKATDLDEKMQAGAVDVPMGTITVAGLAPGAADLSLAVGRMDDDDGFALNPETGTATISVNQLPAPVADFSANVTSGTEPLAVQFTDLSTGDDITARAWDFDNDGITDSTEVNPVYIYDSAGIYTVNLTVTNDGGSSTETKADYITVDAVVLHLDFDPISSTVEEGESVAYAITLDTVPDGLSGYNLTVSLSDGAVGEITGIDLPAWASISSNGTLPSSSVWIKVSDLDKNVQPGAVDVPIATVTVTGLAPGAADLSLDVAKMDDDDGFALDPETGTATFSVNLPTPVADFNADVTSGTCPLTVQFTDLSSGQAITTWAWDFDNNGIIDSTQQNPVHTYTTIGMFTVSLEVSNTAGADVLTRSRYITVKDVPPKPPESSEDFTFDNNGTTFTDIGGQQQVSFNSSVCNGTVAGNDIVLRNGNINVTISTEGLSSVGDVSTGNVSSVLLESSPVSAPLGGEVGNVSVAFNATMNNYNPDLGITTSIFDQPSAEASTAFALAAADEELSITSMAYAVYFTKTNLTEENGLGNAFLEMTVSPEWVEANGGVGAIRVFRQGDDGVTQILDTTYLGINADGMMVFKAFSPDGFSSFAVAATAASATPVSGDDGDDSSKLSAASAGYLKAGDSKILSISNSPVTQIDLEMKNDVSSLLVTVNDERNSPAGAPVPDCDVWRYLSFGLYRANPSAISDAVVTFEVPEGVLGDKTAVLMWLNGNEWKELTTTSVGTKDNNRLFSAEIPEFSWFAIGIIDVGAPSGEIPTEVITPTMTPSTEPTGTPVDTTPVTPATTTSPEDTVPPTQTPLSIAGVLFGAAGAGVLFRKRD